MALFTNSNQIQQVLRFAQEEGIEKEFREALSRMVVASVGPVCTEFLDEYGVPVDLEPEQPRMADLVEEASRKGPDLLEKKRAAEQTMRSGGRTTQMLRKCQNMAEPAPASRALA